MKIAIVGMGYVGLPLALQFARNGVEVVGLDIDPVKVDAINRGESYIKHITADAIKEQVDANRFSASTDFAVIAGSNPEDGGRRAESGGQASTENQRSLVPRL